MSDHGLTEELDSDLIKLFQKDKNILKKLIDELNSNAPHFRLKKIAAIIESENVELFKYISALSAVIHFHTSHKEILDNELKKQELSGVRENIMYFISSLNEQGYNGLNIAYLGELQYSADKKILGFKDELFLKSITDENHKIIGEMPFVRLSLEKIDGQENITVEESLIPLRIFKTLSNNLMTSHTEIFTSVMNYKNKMGNTMVIYDDE